MKITLAFDIERSGATSQHDTIAIGVSVLDENFNELDDLLLKGYVTGITTFEKRCWNEFWSKNLDILHSLRYEGHDGYHQRQKEMIEEFQAFRRKWEQYCIIHDHEFYLVSDNNVYDGGFINQMIFKDLPNTLPIPYCAAKQEYDIFHETFSMQRGILKVVNPEFKSDWCLDGQLEKVYYLPKRKNTDVHNPAHDAYNIAFDYQVMNGIQSGEIKMKPKYILNNI